MENFIIRLFIQSIIVVVILFLFIRFVLKETELKFYIYGFCASVLSNALFISIIFTFEKYIEISQATH